MKKMSASVATSTSFPWSSVRSTSIQRGVVSQYILELLIGEELIKEMLPSLNVEKDKVRAVAKLNQIQDMIYKLSYMYKIDVPFFDDLVAEHKPKDLDSKKLALDLLNERLEADVEVERQNNEKKQQTEKTKEEELKKKEIIALEAAVETASFELFNVMNSFPTDEVKQAAEITLQGAQKALQDAKDKPQKIWRDEVGENFLNDAKYAWKSSRNTSVLAIGQATVNLNDLERAKANSLRWQAVVEEGEIKQTSH